MSSDEAKCTPRIGGLSSSRLSAIQAQLASFQDDHDATVRALESEVAAAEDARAASSAEISRLNALLRAAESRTAAAVHDALSSEKESSKHRTLATVKAAMECLRGKHGAERKQQPQHRTRAWRRSSAAALEVCAARCSAPANASADVAL